MITKKLLLPFIWDYTLNAFGESVHRCIGFEITDRSGICKSSLRLDQHNWFVRLDDDPREFLLEWNGGELTCDELSLFGFTVTSPTWESIVRFYHDFHIADRMELPGLLVDLRKLLVQYLIGFASRNPKFS
jgi:hypothetical protein